MKAETRALLRKLESSENTMLFMDGWMVPLWSWLESERGKEQIAAIAAGKKATLASVVPSDVHGMPSADWLRKYRLTILPTVVPVLADPAAPLLPAPAVQKLMFGLKEPKPRRK